MARQHRPHTAPPEDLRCRSAHPCDEGEDSRSPVLDARSDRLAGVRNLRTRGHETTHSSCAATAVGPIADDEVRRDRTVHQPAHIARGAAPARIARCNGTPGNAGGGATDAVHGDQERQRVGDGVACPEGLSTRCRRSLWCQWPLVAAGARADHHPGSGALNDVEAREGAVVAGRRDQARASRRSWRCSPVRRRESRPWPSSEGERPSNGPARQWLRPTNFHRR